MDASRLVLEVLVKGKVVEGVTVVVGTKDVGISGRRLFAAVGNDLSHYFVGFLAGNVSGSGSGGTCRRRGGLLGR